MRVLLLLLATTVAAQSPPVVGSFDRFHRAEPVSARGGLLLLGELGCTACHAADARVRALLSVRRAPRLHDVAARMSTDALRGHIGTPAATRPGTTMPDVWHTLSAGERDAEVEAIVHFLQSRGSGDFALTATDDGAARRGEALFHQVGCVACHAPQDGGPPPRGSVPIARMAGHYDVDEVARFLRDPLQVRPSGRMPSLGLSEREARDVAHFLCRGTRTPAALRYTLYRGPLISFDDHEERTPWATGVTGSFDLGVAGRREDYSLRFDGFLEVPRPGRYTFHVSSDDGSRVHVDGAEIIDNDGVRDDHRPRSQSATIELARGWHAFAVEYFQRRRDATLVLEWEGPGLPRAPIPSASLRAWDGEVSAPPTLRPDPGQVERGGRAFVQRGCAACHEPEGAVPRGAPLAALAPAHGCLADPVPGSAPRYGLDDTQRQALAAALAVLGDESLLRNDAVRNDAAKLRHGMETYQCFACHARGGVGGVPDDREGWFTSDGHDLGAEGRIPPHLDGVGDKLDSLWLKRVLVEGASVRPYIRTRMPRFGVPEVHELAAQFVRLDRVGRPVVPRVDSTEALREVGRRLVGQGGAACILCHDFNRRQATTMGVVDLVDTTRRLNEDWFDKFVRWPDGYRAGTRMPSFWPQGHSAFPGFLGGDATRQIQAMWTYFADGERAVDPAGLSRQSLELVVGGEAVVYRGKLWEAGWRAIAVGFAERVSCAFDAQQVRLALLWKGRFLDVAAHWRSQGMGRIRPRGEDVEVLPAGPPFAVLASGDAAWPERTGRDGGYRFRGYDLDASRRPTFRYEFDGVAITDTPRATEHDGRSGLRRVVRLTSPTPRQLWLRVLGGTIEQIDAKTFRRGGLEVRIEGAAPLLVGSGAAAELRATATIAGGSAEIEVHYTW